MGKATTGDSDDERMVEEAAPLPLKKKGIRKDNHKP
jgi:hypothetical protein